MKLVNLTPHEINIIKDGLPVLNLPPSGELARVSTSRRLVETLHNGVEIYDTNYGEPVGLPAPQDGVYYIVSTLVRTACPDREDLLSPGTLVRDESGQPVGCMGLTR